MDVLITLIGIKNILKTALAMCWGILKLAGFATLIAALVCFLGFFLELCWYIGKEAAATVIEYYIWRGGIF